MKRQIYVATALLVCLLASSCATGPHELTLRRAVSVTGSLFWTKRMDQSKEELVPPAATPYQDASEQAQYIKGFADAWEFQVSLRLVGAVRVQHDAKMKDIDEMSKKPEKRVYARGFQDGTRAYSDASGHALDEAVEFKKQMERSVRQGYTW